MNKLLTGKVAIAAGPSVHIIASIVQMLLQEGATVIVPAKSAVEIATLKESLTDINTGKLVTFLTNYPDYDKVFEISESITEQYGSIDIAIICFDSVTVARACNIIETDIMDWEKMIDNNITAFFVSAGVVLGSMKKHNKGMFVSVINSIGFDNKNGNAVAGLTSCMQTEMAKMFYEEARRYNIRCYHVILKDDAGNNGSMASPNNEKKITNNAIGNFIMKLYNGGSDENLFQNLKITAQINNAESL